MIGKDDNQAHRVSSSSFSLTPLSFDHQLSDGNEKLRNNLQSVDYSSRYALGLFYEDGAEVALEDSDVAAQYVTNHPIIRFVALDHRKRGAGDCIGGVLIL